MHLQPDLYPLPVIASITSLTVVIAIAITRGMAKTPPIGVRIDSELRSFLEREAEKDKRSLSSLIHKILEEWRRTAAKGKR